MTPQDSQHRAQERPKTANIGPKSDPRPPTYRPLRPQIDHFRPQMPQDCHHRLQERPKSANIGPKTVNTGPKTANMRPKTAKKCPESFATDQQSQKVKAKIQRQNMLTVSFGPED